MALLTSFRSRSFAPGFNDYLGGDDETGLHFRILVLEPGQTQVVAAPGMETALVLIRGTGALQMHGETIAFARRNWRDENPLVAHLAASDRLTLEASAACRFAVIQTRNAASFSARVYRPTDIGVEHRGKDILDGSCYRLVRLAFDRTIAPAAAKLVVGEVLNYPGRWSSYPPHHHAQPEIYYYEFDPDCGYGHGELGDEVHKIYHQDLLKITANRDHSQVAAPGYHLYYIWAIRHLDDSPYTGFEFTKPHDRLL